MTRDEIKKALKTCSVDSCTDCPYDNKGLYCCGKLKRDALDLITEQENEIARLKDDYARVQEQFAQYQMASDKEIAAQVKQAKIDVLKELKSKAWQGYQVGMYIVDTQQIEELIEEVENDK